MKKKLIIALTMLCVLCIALGLTACSSKSSGRLPSEIMHTEHIYDNQNTDVKYLKSMATCTEAAQYYYSCSCGEKGTETFSSGVALGHRFGEYVVDSNATCTQDATKIAHCERRNCDATDVVVEVGSATGHTKVYKNNNDGTHQVTCEICQEIIEASEKCSYANNVCIYCGAVMPATISEVEGGSVDGTDIFMLVSQDTKTVAMYDKITVGKNDIWAMYWDVTCTQEIISQTAAAQGSSELNPGENTFYILVRERGGTARRLYTLTIYRSYAVSVNYYSGATLLKTETAYTGYTYEASYQPNIPGYTFNQWKVGGKPYTQDILWDELNLYADISVITYDIVYELNGGTNNSQNPTTYTVENTTIVLKNATKNGYNFDGWYADSKFNNQTAQIEQGSLGNVVLYAKWVPVTYTVRYELNGGTNDASNVTTYTVESETIALASPTKAGYNFDGWYTDGSFANAVSEITHGSFGNKTLFAKWKAVEYTIAYNLNGGTNNSQNPSTYTIESGNVVFAQPTRTGYTFAGWYVNSALTEEITQIPTGSMGDTVVYAKWNIVAYTISYNLNGGTNNSSNVTSYTVEDAVALYAPQKFAYDFDGWYTSPLFMAGTRVDVIAKGTVGDKTLYAKYIAVDYTITYHLDGGTNNSQNPVKYNIESAVTLANPEKAGYVFDGWYTSNDYATGTQVNNIAVGSTGNKDLYAKFTAIDYNITYHLNGGSNGTGNPATYTVDDQITLANAEKAGYRFVGWYTSSNFAANTKITTIYFGSTGDQEVYAKFEVVEYDITYNLNGGKNSDDNPDEYTVEGRVVLKDASKAGYTFAGWFTTDDFQEGSQVSTFEVGTYGNKTLYAKFVAINYSITYHLYGGNNGASNPATYTVNNRVVLANPEKTGYTFLGWYTTEDFQSGTLISTISIGTTGDKDIYAKFEVITYSITYNLDNGTNDSANPDEYTVESDFVLKDASKTGYTFGGWFTTEIFEVESQVTKIQAGTCGDTTLYAQFIAIEYTITYHLDGGTNSVYNWPIYTISGGAYFHDAEKAGYTFDGWYTSADFTHDTKITMIPDGSMGDKDVYAKFNVIEYNISYNLSGGTNDSRNPDKYTVENRIILKDASKPGYDFAGWYTSENFQNGALVSAISKGTTGDKTLYAKFTPTTYYITYYLDGGTNSSLNYYRYTVENAVTLESPSKSLFNFAGWYTTPDFQEGTEITQIEVGSIGDVSVWALWETKYVTLTLVTPDGFTIHQQTVAAGEYSLQTLFESSEDWQTNFPDYHIHYLNWEENCNAAAWYPITNSYCKNMLLDSDMTFYASLVCEYLDFIYRLPDASTLILPDSIGTIMSYTPLTQIGGNGYNCLTSLTSVRIPYSVTKMENAFNDCPNLKYISSFENESSVREIVNSFNRCSELQSVNNLAQLTKLENSFNDCPKLQSIGSFDGSGLTELNNVFNYCPKLQSVGSFDGSGLTELNNVFNYCAKLQGPVDFSNTALTRINFSFEECTSLQNVYLPYNIADTSYSFNNCTSLNYYTYDNALYLGNSHNNYLVLMKAVDEDITSCQIHPETSVIGFRAFEFCRQLITLFIPNQVRYILGNAFRNCINLQYLYVPSTVSTFYTSENIESTIILTNDNGQGWGHLTSPYAVVANCSFADRFVEIRQDDELVGYACIVGTPYTRNVIVPETENGIPVTKIIIENGLGRLFLPSTINCIEKSSSCYSTIWEQVEFMGYNPDYYVADGVVYTADGESAVMITLEAGEVVRIASGTTTIEERAFYWVTPDTYSTVQEIVLPEGVTTIKSRALFCSSIIKFSLPSTLTTLERGALGSLIKSETLQGNTYDGALYLGNSCNPYLLLVRVGSSTTTLAPETKFIYDHAFCNSEITSITLPDTLTYIGEGAFISSSITSITIPASVTYIGEGAFTYCSKLTEIVFEETEGWTAWESTYMPIHYSKEQFEYELETGDLLRLLKRGSRLERE